MGTGEKFLNKTVMAGAVTLRINKWDLIKLQIFCKAKYIINKTKRPPKDWERIFTNPKSGSGLISNIYKELKELNSRKSNNPIKKWGTELNKEFSTLGYSSVENLLFSSVPHFLKRDIWFSGVQLLEFFIYILDISPISDLGLV